MFCDVKSCDEMEIETGYFKLGHVLLEPQLPMNSDGEILQSLNQSFEHNNYVL